MHFVDDGLDTGPIIAQAAVPVLDGDDEATLAARILVEEHRLYPAAAARAWPRGACSVARAPGDGTTVHDACDLQQRYELIARRRHRGGARRARARSRATGKPVVVVSACLLGVRCRYDGGDKATTTRWRARAGDAEILPLCPEVLARFGVPRPAITLHRRRSRATDSRAAT